MVVSQDIPDEHHVARYCSGSQHDDGRVLPVTFQLRSQGETYLSVNWLEYFGLNMFDEALARICADKRGLGFSIRHTGRFAVLNAEIVRSISRDLSDLSEMIHPLTVTHLPEVGDESHSGIGGYPHDDMRLLVADLLAENVDTDMLMTPVIP